VDAKGRPITDDARLTRIRALAIPPAWRDVWISPNANAKLQATGVDRAGRRQYLYHPAFRAAQEERKYERLVRFGEGLPALREVVAAHLEHGPYGQDWACALAVTFVNRAWFRVGSERYARTSRTYGVTTLTKRHASVRGSRVTFGFPAKHRVRVRTTVVDAELAAAVRALLDYPGGPRLFRFDREGRPANLTGPILNAYIAEHLDEGFTAKDFRTWGGTLAAAVGLAELGPPETEADERRVLASVMRAVGAELGNTPAVARSSYVSPAVIEQWRDGRTLEHFRKRSLRTVSARDRGLLPEEDALLSLLRSWRIRRARAAAA
jgi:DNA topoisomerase-1